MLMSQHSTPIYLQFERFNFVLCWETMPNEDSGPVSDRLNCSRFLMKFSRNSWLCEKKETCPKEDEKPSIYILMFLL